MPAPIKLCPDEARKLVLLSQRLPWVKPSGPALDATLAALRHLGYIQIDTISVIERAHHHTCWNRARRYQAKHLDELLRQKKIFEYWSHAAAYLPMEDYRFSLPRMRAFANGQRHWFQPDPQLMKATLRRIASEGPLRSQDFAAESAGRAKPGMWDWKPAKQALEQLFMEGKLMTLRRQGFQKVYDLAERVLPAGVNTAMPSEAEYGRFLITRFLRANGLGKAAEIAYLRRGVKAIVDRMLAQMTGRGEVVLVQVMPTKTRIKTQSTPGQSTPGQWAQTQPRQGTDKTYYALPDSLQLLGRPWSRKRLKILSPFDNLLIQRQRMRDLFAFDYQIECYTPANKRRHGYFSLPLLWDGKLVARMDCKAERQRRALVIRNFVSEPSLVKKERLAEALVDELKRFAAFNHCDQVETEELRDQTIQGLLACRLKQIY